MILEFIISSKVSKDLFSEFAKPKAMSLFLFLWALEFSFQLLPGSSTIWWRLAQMLTSKSHSTWTIAPKQYFTSGSPFSRRPLNRAVVPIAVRGHGAGGETRSRCCGPGLPQPPIGPLSPDNVLRPALCEQKGNTARGGLQRAPKGERQTGDVVSTEAKLHGCLCGVRGKKAHLVTSTEWEQSES